MANNTTPTKTPKPNFDEPELRAPTFAERFQAMWAIPSIRLGFIVAFIALIAIVVGVLLISK